MSRGSEDVDFVVSEGAQKTVDKFVTTESSQTSFLNCFYTNATSIDSPRKMGLLLAELTKDG